MIFAKDRILMMIPTKRAVKKEPLNWFQAAFIPSDFRVFIKFKFTLLIDANNSS